MITTKIFKNQILPIWKTLKNRVRPIRQRDLVFESGEGKVSWDPGDKRLLQMDKLIYMQIEQWLSESKELHQMWLPAKLGVRERIIDLPFLNMVRERYYVEGGDDLILALVYSNFILRNPKTGEKLLERIKQAIGRYYGDFLTEEMKQTLSMKGIPAWSGTIRNRMTGAH